MLPPAHRTENVRYAIRNIVAEATKLEAQGRKVLYFNIGDPLKFGFSTPPHLIDAVAKAMRDGDNGYAPSAGIPAAREAIAREVSARGVQGVTPQDVVVTSGASEAIEMALTALVDSGDSVLLPSPGYPLYSAVAAKLGIEAIPYQLDEERGWALDLEELARVVRPNTRAIVIGTPCNPTGGQYGRKALEGLLELARRHNLVVLSDEIYDRLTYEDPHVSIASLARDVPVLLFNGLSKSYLACGWRIGWMVFCNGAKLGELRGAVQRLADARLCAPTPQQHAIAAALDGPQSHFAPMMEKLRERRDLTVRRLSSIRGISVVPPAGAFYAMPRINLPQVTDDEQFILGLLRATGVLFVHGSGFGQRPGTQHFRVVFLPPPEVLNTAFDLLSQYVASL